VAVRRSFITAAVSTKATTGLILASTPASITRPDPALWDRVTSGFSDKPRIPLPVRITFEDAAFVLEKSNYNRLAPNESPETHTDSMLAGRDWKGDRLIAPDLLDYAAIELD
jgi:hypothetical protein